MQSIPLSKDSDAKLITSQHIVKPLNALPHLARFKLTTEAELLNWRTGRQLIISSNKIEPSLGSHLSLIQDSDNFIVVLDPVDEVVGIANWDSNSSLQPKVVFNALG